MDRSLRPFSLTAVALALVIWAGLVPSGAPVGPREPARVAFTITGDALGPGVDWADLARGELVRDEHGRVEGLRLFALLEAAGRLGLREGDLLWAVDGMPVDGRFPGLTRVLPRRDARWCLSLLRDGAPRELCYALDPPPVARIDLRIKGDVLGPGVRIDDLIDAEPLPSGGFRLSGFDERGPAWQFGLRNGDVVRHSPLVPPRVFQDWASQAARRTDPPPICLSVVRDGEPLELCYTIIDLPPPVPIPTDERQRTRDELMDRVRARRLEREARRRDAEPTRP